MPPHNVIWNSFSMQPVSPIVAANPVTRSLNMVAASDGTWRRREAFTSGSGPGGSVMNAITAELNDVSYLVVKTSSAVQAYNGTSWMTLAGVVDEDDPPVGGATVSSTSRGSFSIHGGELYYADETNVFAWDGNASGLIRRPGVKSLRNHVYWESTDPPGFDLAKKEGTSVEDITTFYSMAGAAHEDSRPRNDPLDGEKILNTGFCFSIFDPKRRIFGRRSEVFSLPYVFGPANPDAVLLTDERWQYAKAVDVPGEDFIPEGYQVAIWFTLGQHIVTNVQATHQSGFLSYSNVSAPSASERMSEVVFLEAIVERGAEEVSCRKGNESLFRSGQYTDIYARPVPCKLMAILQNGVALYFSPRNHEDGATDENSVFGNYIEYSVKHPEQVGRNTENDQDTRSPYPNIRGIPIYAINHAGRTLIMTRQGVYQIGFDGTNVLLSELVGGRGMRAPDGISQSSLGLAWMSDEGVVLFTGGGVSIIDRKLGFGDWFKQLDTDDKAKAAIGVCERENQMLMSIPVPDGGSNDRRIVCYDYEQSTVSELQPESGVVPDRMVNFTSDDESRLLVFSGSSMHEYPGGESGTFPSMVEFWLSENPHKSKTLQELILDIGPNDEPITVSCATFEALDDPGPLGETEVTQEFAASEVHRRLSIETWMGMRAKLFRFRVTADEDAVWSIARAIANYNTDEGDNVFGV